LKSVLEIGGHFEGLNRKVQLKPIDVVDNEVVSALMIVKWGGELTRDGEEDSLKLGEQFRKQYPENKEGLLRLHSTYRHDLKTYSSD
jgi:inositol hexakisphosphate/diphosphoinositol-pentakisphosphate kinase